MHTQARTALVHTCTHTETHTGYTHTHTQCFCQSRLRSHCTTDTDMSQVHTDTHLFSSVLQTKRCLSIIGGSLFQDCSKLLKCSYGCRMNVCKLQVLILSIRVRCLNSQNGSTPCHGTAWNFIVTANVVHRNRCPFHKRNVAMYVCVLILCSFYIYQRIFVMTDFP